MDQHLSKILGMTPISDALDSWGLIRPLLALLLEESFPAVFSCRELGMQGWINQGHTSEPAHHRQSFLNTMFTAWD